MIQPHRSATLDLFAGGDSSDEPVQPQPPVLDAGVEGNGFYGLAGQVDLPALEGEPADRLFKIALQHAGEGEIATCRIDKVSRVQVV